MANNSARRNHSISLPEDQQKLLELANSVNQDIDVMEKSTLVIVALSFSAIIFCLVNIAQYFSPEPDPIFSSSHCGVHAGNYSIYNLSKFFVTPYTVIYLEA